MYARRYAAVGALFGLGFPIVATLIEAATRYGSASAVARAQGSPLLWIIDTVPIVVGLLAGFAGWQRDGAGAAESKRRAEVTTTAQELFTTAQTLLSTVSSFSSMTSETAASVRETTATMGQLGHTATKAALTAETVIGLAQKSERCSEDGLSAAEAITGELMQLGEQVRGMSQIIESLNDRMRDIFEIASVVSFVADRSQRLADAAMGEVDKGAQAKSLQQLAGEIRRQADEAKNASSQVKGILGEVHKAMVAAMAAAEAGVRRAEQGAAVANSTGDAIRRLASAFRESSEAARDIATVAQQQDHAFDQVLKAMNEIYLATQETMASTQQVATEARALNDLATGLRRQVQA
ncbi:MAG TPA: methyl-accepting chemotaxis protein [Anaeromyxobacteraceae bacterium]|nr:methyl-accepting chemotaxis protein [Anaeromyxobacteraceae bacterium]